MSLALVGRISGVLALALVGTGLSIHLTTVRTTSITPLAAVSGRSPYARCPVGSSIASPRTAAGTIAYPNSAVEPYVAADPRTVGTSHANVIGVWQQDRFPDAGARGLVGASSFDGGRTWTERSLPFTRCAHGGLPYPVASDPWVSIGPDGTAYASALVGDPAVPMWGVAVAISHDGGRSWQNIQTIIRDRCCDFSDKEAVTADPNHSGVAYLVWSRDQGDSRPTWFSKTTDGGRTWVHPRPILQGRGVITAANQIVVDPRTDTLDDILSLARDRPAPLARMQASADGGELPNKEVGEVALTWSVAIMRSRNGGDTWSAPVAVAQEEAVGVPAATRRIRTGTEIPSAAIDRKTGAISVVWQDGRFHRGAYDEIVLATSVDGGVHWTSPRRVGGDTGWPAFTPAVTVTAGGVIGVTFYRFRNLPLDDPGLPTDYWLTWSTDGGSHFDHELRLAGPFDILAAPNSDGPFLGDYEGLTALGDTFVPFFVETTSGGTQVVTRTITHTGQGPLPSTIPTLRRAWRALHRLSIGLLIRKPPSITQPPIRWHTDALSIVRHHGAGPTRRSRPS